MAGGRVSVEGEESLSLSLHFASPILAPRRQSSGPLPHRQAASEAGALRERAAAAERARGERHRGGLELRRRGRRRTSPFLGAAVVGGCVDDVSKARSMRADAEGVEGSCEGLSFV